MDDDIEWGDATLLIKSLRTLSCEDDNREKECVHENIILDDGAYVCKDCNCMMYQQIDQGAEWRFYGNDDNKGSDPTRCGMPTNDLLPNSSLGSVIGFANKETYDMKLMRKYHMWNSMSYKERSLYNIFEGLSLTAINGGIPKSIVDEAKMLYKGISETRISRGDNRCALIASSIYISCKKNGVPRSTKEIAKIFNINLSAMTKGCKKFQEMMKLNMDSTQASDFINRFCSKLGLDNDKKTICRNVVQIAEDLSIVSENTPPSIAAGAIFLCSTHFKWGLNKKDISEACDISQVTISKCFKKMEPHRSKCF